MLDFASVQQQKQKQIPNILVGVAQQGLGLYQRRHGYISMVPFTYLIPRPVNHM
jgi:hypothetical protein